MRTLETVKVKTLGPSMGPNGGYFLNEEGRGVLGYDFQRENLNGPNSNGWVCTKNIMVDTRVCRGNTYARPIISESEKRNKYLQEKRKRGLLTRYKNGFINRRLGTPPPVKGRVHVQVQTMEKFEDLYDELLEREMKMAMETTSINQPVEGMNDSTVLHNDATSLKITG